MSVQISKWIQAMSCYKYSQPNTATFMGARPRMPGSSFNSTQLGTKATIWKRVLMISVSCFSVITPTMQFDSIRVFTRVPGMRSMQALTPYAWLPGIDRNGRRATVFGGRVWKLWQPKLWSTVVINRDDTRLWYSQPVEIGLLWNTLKLPLY